MTSTGMNCRSRSPSCRRPDGGQHGMAKQAIAAARDFVGYGGKPPDPKWPQGARLAVNFVLNYEEGSEASFEHGDGYSETGLTDGGSVSRMKGRDLGAEGLFEYGSRAGFWRIRRLFME